MESSPFDWWWVSIFNLFRVFDRAAVTSHPNDIKEKKKYKNKRRDVQRAVFYKLHFDLGVY